MNQGYALLLHNHNSFIHIALKRFKMSSSFMDLVLRSIEFAC